MPADTETPVSGVSLCESGELKQSEMDVARRSSSHETADTSGRNEESPRSCRTPLYAWPLLILSVLAPSTAGPVFDTMPDVPPVTLASWRAQTTTLLLVLPGIYQLSQLDSGQRQKALQNIHLLAASGFSLGVHFAAWVWGLYHTSLPHSLLCMSSSPVLLAIGCLLMRKPISAGELGGTALAGVGAIFLAAGSGSNKGVSLVGDCVCLLSACLFLAYMAIGRRLRSWMPLFVYIFPVTLMGALVLSAGSLAIDRSSPAKTGPGGLFGWVHERYLPATAWLAAGPGLLGHASLNALLRWLHPLQVAASLPVVAAMSADMVFALDPKLKRPQVWVLGAEDLQQVVLPQSLTPVLGSLEGWMLGVAALPSGLSTHVGAALVLLASVVVLVASHLRSQAGERSKDTDQVPAKAPLQKALQLATVPLSEATALLRSHQADDAPDAHAAYESGV